MFFSVGFEWPSLELDTVTLPSRKIIIGLLKTDVLRSNFFSESRFDIRERTGIAKAKFQLRWSFFSLSRKVGPSAKRQNQTLNFLLWFMWNIARSFARQWPGYYFAHRWKLPWVLSKIRDCLKNLKYTFSLLHIFFKNSFALFSAGVHMHQIQTKVLQQTTGFAGRKKCPKLVIALGIFNAALEWHWNEDAQKTGKI